ITEFMGHEDKLAPLTSDACANGCAAVVEFVNVANVPELLAAGARTARRGAPVRGGAGLELDLADRRQFDRIPAELRAALPEQGLVNHREAQAVVCTLERLVGDRAGNDATEPHAAEVAVIALYPAQALLIRQLVESSQVLRESRLRVAIGVPETFREREF